MNFTSTATHPSKGTDDPFAAVSRKSGVVNSPMSISWVSIMCSSNHFLDIIETWAPVSHKAWTGCLCMVQLTRHFCPTSRVSLPCILGVKWQIMRWFIEGTGVDGQGEFRDSFFPGVTSCPPEVTLARFPTGNHERCDCHLRTCSSVDIHLQLLSPCRRGIPSLSSPSPAVFLVALIVVTA